MTRDIKSLSQMNADSLQYLAENTDITFLSEGSIARSLVEATNLEIARVQEYISANQSNCYLNTAAGYYLDLIGEMLGVRRLNASSGSANSNDGNVQFYVNAGNLGDKLPDYSNANQGKISAGLKVMTADGSIIYRVVDDVFFPRTNKSVFVSVLSEGTGPSYKVGRGKLVSHNGPSGVQVTNLKSIDNASSIESDSDYRFRLSNATASRSTANEIAVKLAAIGSSDIANVSLQEFARGAGTYDALLIPIGNSVSFRSSEGVKRSIEAVTAFGISARVKQPDYVKFKLTIQLISISGAAQGITDVNKLNAKNAVLSYIDTIQLGGELIINRIRAAVIDSVTQDVKDINILELSLDNKPHVIRNIKLKNTELLTPDNTDSEAVTIL